MPNFYSVSKEKLKNIALRFVLMIGVVSFFADFTCEGARSVTGPYLAILGASATLVGFIAGLGELLGYGLRLVSGRLSERIPSTAFINEDFPRLNLPATTTVKRSSAKRVSRLRHGCSACQRLLASFSFSEATICPERITSASSNLMCSYVFKSIVDA
jgi:hypothetical protein